MEGETGFQVGGKHHSCVTKETGYGGRESTHALCWAVVTPSIRRSEGALRRKDVLTTEGKRALLPEQSSVSP